MLKFITYNVWFGAYEKIRINEICNIILQKSPDFICLQEVTENMLNNIKSKLNNYHLSRNIITNYDTLILSKTPIESINTIQFENSKMNRNIHYIKTTINDRLVTVVTTHLESDFSKESVKYSQLSNIFNKFENQVNVFIMGDTNIIEDISPQKYNDAWKNDGGLLNKMYTFDFLLNNNVIGDYRSRLDRVFYSKDYKCQHFELIGMDNNFNCGNLPPSDHFGIYTCFQ